VPITALSGSAGGAMSIPWLAAGHPLPVLVSSVRSKELGRLSDAGLKDAAVLLFVIDPAARNPMPVSQLMDAYGLTQAEARVALVTSSGSTVLEAARLLISPPIRSRRVFAKTATGRQTELARSIAALGSVRIIDEPHE
jgi:hypothetical protein